jgi:hypothetical protein
MEFINNVYLIWDKKISDANTPSEKRNKEILGGGIIELSFLYSISVKRNTIIIFTLLVLVVYWIFILN